MTISENTPMVKQIAHDPHLFTYLRDCPGEHDVVIGDARLRIAEAPDGEYEMIVGEAFSSDAIPVHLMTREAVDMYFDKLRDDGILVMHISNRHLELEPVLGDIARDKGLSCYGQYDYETEDIPFKVASHFVVMAREDADFGNLLNTGLWQPCAANPNSDNVWTDDFSNLLSTFNWR